MNVVTSTLQYELKSVAEDIDDLLAKLVGADCVSGEVRRPERLVESMRYASLGGGKRIRPFLTVACGNLFDAPRARLLYAGAAIECVHCYSLVHDDLPAMDNDALRRGRPTVHKAFDEATAILAGDALLTLAFDIMSRRETHPDASVRLELVQKLSRAAGVGGMVGGQMLDLAAEGRFGDGNPLRLDTDSILKLELMKTGALIAFACTAAGILAGADAEARVALYNYGSAIGEAFQIADDLLDRVGDGAKIGKAVGKDAKAGKATLVDCLGDEAAREKLRGLVTRAEGALALFGKRARLLAEAAQFIATRDK